jgi:hypothetical protein
MSVSSSVASFSYLHTSRKDVVLLMKRSCGLRVHGMFGNVPTIGDPNTTSPVCQQLTHRPDTGAKY